MEGKIGGKEDVEQTSEEVSVGEERARALYSPEVAAANLKAIAAYSRNFLPLLFNLFVASTAEKRGDLQVSCLHLGSTQDAFLWLSFVRPNCFLLQSVMSG